jgi:hypothetical protein
LILITSAMVKLGLMPPSVAANSAAATAKLARRGARRRDRGSNNAKALRPAFATRRRGRHGEAVTTFSKWLLWKFASWVFI